MKIIGKANLDWTLWLSTLSLNASAGLQLISLCYSLSVYVLNTPYSILRTPYNLGNRRGNEAHCCDFAAGGPGKVPP